MEVLAGARSDTHLRDLRGLLARGTLVPTVSGDYEDAATLYRACRRGGETVRRLIDCLIAAVAIRADVPVLHSDADFDVLARRTALRLEPHARVTARSRSVGVAGHRPDCRSCRLPSSHGVGLEAGSCQGPSRSRVRAVDGKSRMPVPGWSGSSARHERSIASCDGDRMVKVCLAAYSTEWPRTFEAEHDRIVSALGDVALEVHHAGSTSVPGLRAKPIIDIALVVPDTTDEGAYVPPLEAIGYTFRLREPEWFEHRLLRHDVPAVNLHVFPPRCTEVTRMLAFRDHLRLNDQDRLVYESTKAALSEREWPTVQDYANAKDDVVADIMSRVDLR